MNRIISNILIILIILIIIIIYNILKKSNSWEAPSITHINNIIDNSHFFRRMTRLDLLARNTISQEDYIKTYKANIKLFTLDEEKLLDSLIKEINAKYIENYYRLKNIKWKFVKIDESIEHGFAHTIADSIFLSSNFFKNPRINQIETLIHEKIHLFQRFYPIENAKLITSLGFKHFNTQTAYLNIRNNPDTDSFVYINGETVQAQIYNSNTPNSITDSHTAQIIGKIPWNIPSSIHQHDHPNEINACGISQQIVGSLSEHPYKQKIILWIKEFL